MYKCKKCGKEFEKQTSLAAHGTVHSEKWLKNRKIQKIRIKKECEKCGTEFEIERTLNKDGTERIPKYEKRFCSRSCANGHKHTEEWKKKISESLKREPIFCKTCGKEIRPNKFGYCNECWKKSDEFLELILENSKK